MAQLTKTTPGNVVDVPKPETKIKWVSSEEYKAFEKFLHKNYVPKDDSAFAKQYFVRPITIIPYTPAEANASTSQSLYWFLCQKFHKKKIRSVGVSDGKGGRETIEDNESVVGHRMIESGRMGEGTWECIDEFASFSINVRDFKEQYQSDTEE